MNNKLFVGNLLYEVGDDELFELFSQIGEVVSAQVIRFKDTGRSRGFGFVEMKEEEKAKEAIEKLNGKDYKGRKLIVAKANPKREGGRRRKNFTFKA